MEDEDETKRENLSLYIWSDTIWSLDLGRLTCKKPS